VAFLAVYIAEAHSADEWPAGETLSYCNQPTTLDERVTVASNFLKETNFQIPLLLDNMNNQFHQTLAAWPFRFYIVDNGRIALKAQPGNQDIHFCYDIMTVFHYLTVRFHGL